MKNDVGFIPSLVGGGGAGLAVDIALFPLDTIKTRLQSEVGFRSAGGLRSLYNGLGPAALGSAPNEVTKQRRQIRAHTSSMQILKECLLQEGVRGLYRGYWSTVMREIPFSFIQYPLWEFFKEFLASRQRKTVNSLESALAGALAGGISAALTTPLDVAKTRIMLARNQTKEAEGKVLSVLLGVYHNEGIRGLYSGMTPRSMAMALGGAIYFGVYQLILRLLL